MLLAGASETRSASVVSNTIDHGELEAGSFSLEQNASCSSMPDIPILSSSGSIPTDQLQMVQNINSLIVEVCFQKTQDQSLLSSLVNLCSWQALSAIFVVKCIVYKKIPFHSHAVNWILFFILKLLFAASIGERRVDTRTGF